MPSLHSLSVSFTSRANACRCVTKLVRISAARRLGAAAWRSMTAGVMLCSSRFRMAAPRSRERQHTPDGASLQRGCAPGDPARAVGGDAIAAQHAAARTSLLRELTQQELVHERAQLVELWLRHVPAVLMSPHL